MRGSTRIGLLAISVACMCAFAGATAFGDADDELRDKSVGGELLRDIGTLPANQPDALEFINTGDLKLVVGTTTRTCKEVELGMTVVKARLGMELAIPFGVTENDLCTVPTRFDTTAEGAVGNAVNSKVASVIIGDNANLAFVAEFHNLKLSQQIAVGEVCTWNLDGIQASVGQVTMGFVEEKTPNLNVTFSATKVPIAGPVACGTEGKLTAEFFLDTPSTPTDTAWFDS